LKRIFKVIFIGISIFIISFVISISLFLNFYPTIGGTPLESDIVKFQKSGHYRDGIFVNQIKTEMDMNFGKVMSILNDYYVGIPNQFPENPLPVLKIDSMDIVSRMDSIPRVTWFGHSAFLIEMSGKNILFDPMFGDVAAPLLWLGSDRFSDGLPIEIEKLPFIDAVLFSHDHYDHLDHGSNFCTADRAIL